MEFIQTCGRKVGNHNPMISILKLGINLSYRKDVDKSNSQNECWNGVNKRENWLQNYQPFISSFITQSKPDAHTHLKNKLMMQRQE
jgi:hypothetical protein